MSTVWIVFNDRRKDFSRAEQFGNLRDIFSSIGREYNGDKLIEYVRAVLENSEPDDHILMVGDPALCAIATTVMAEIHGTVNVLRWDRDNFAYKPLSLTFYEEE